MRRRTRVEKDDAAGAAAEAHISRRTVQAGHKDAPQVAQPVPPAPPAQQLPQALAQSRQESAPLLARAASLQIRGKADLEVATPLLTAFKGLLDAAEAKRKHFTAPLNEAVKRINAEFAALRKPLEDADQALRWKVLCYRQEEERKAEEARLKAEEAARKAAERRDAAERAKGKGAKRAEETAAAAEEESRVATEAYLAAAPAPMMGVGERHPWTFEVQDLAKVPREYLCLDSAAVRKAIRAGAREVPGLRIYQEHGLAVGGR